MNNEIKEILDDLKNEDNYIEDYEFRYKRIALDDVWQLLDYITNLQQENERLKQYNDDDFLYSYEELQDKVIKLQKENQDLNRMCELYSKSLYYAELKDYKSRVENYKQLLDELKDILNYEVEQYPNYDEDNYSYYVKTTLERVLEEITALEGTYIGKDK